MQTRDFGRLFVHTLHLQPDAPRFHIAQSVSTDPPYRLGRPVVIRLFRGFSVAIGWWMDTGWDEEEALMAAVIGYGVDPYDDDLDDPEVRQTIRENIAAHTTDIDSEWEIISMLGVQE